MSGRKLFTNRGPNGVAVTLIVRASHDPRNSAGTQSFFLSPGESQWQEYGDAINIYLNGINLAVEHAGAIRTEQAVVITRGAPLDDELNTRNAVDFVWSNDSYHISTRQVG